MTGKLPSRRRLVAILALLPAVAACATPPPRLFTLAPRPGKPDDRVVATIGVRRVELAKYLDRPEIVRHIDPYQLGMSDYVRWGEGLGDMVTRVLVADLAQRLPRSQLYAAAGPLAPPSPGIVLEVNIDKFEPEPSSAVVLAAQWLAHRERVSDRIQSEQLRVAMAADNPAAQIAAMSDALAQLADRIAGGLAA